MRINPPISVKDLSDFLGARWIGNPDELITGLNEIHMVEPGDITFTDHPKYFKKSLLSAASVVLINAEPEDRFGKSIIISNDPFSDFMRIIQKYRDIGPNKEMISPSAKVGKNLFLGHGSSIGDNCVVGDNCVIHPNVTIYSNCIIGDNAIIHAGTVIGADAFYFKRRENSYEKFLSSGRVVIGNNVEIGALCTIDKGVTGDTIIGDDSKFDNQVHIGHDTFIGKRVLMAAQCAVAGVCVIEDDVILWGQVGVTKEMRIGKGAQVMAKSGVINHLEAGKRYLGNPTSEAFSKNREWLLLKKLPELVKKVGL